MKREYTATVYIVQEEQTLLIFHKKHRKWLPPGGHVEPDELPHLAAIREAKEETGLDIELIAQENLFIEKNTQAQSIPRPYLMLLEKIPGRSEMGPHEHIDMIYVASVTGGILHLNTEETENIKWFNKSEIENLEELFPDTREIALHLMDAYHTHAPSPLAFSHN